MIFQPTYTVFWYSKPRSDVHRRLTGRNRDNVRLGPVRVVLSNHAIGRPCAATRGADTRLDAPLVNVTWAITTLG